MNARSTILQRPTAEARGVQVFWRGSGNAWLFRPHPEACRLRDQFRQTLKTDWFYASAQAYAADLDAAITEASANAEVLIEANVGMEAESL